MGGVEGRVFCEFACFGEFFDVGGVEGVADGVQFQDESAGVGVPGEPHGADAEFFIDGGDQRPVVGEQLGGVFAGGAPGEFVEQVVDPVGEYGHLGFLDADGGGA